MANLWHVIKLIQVWITYYLWQICGILNFKLLAFQVYITLGGCGGPERTEICIAVDFYFDILVLCLMEHL